MPRLFLPPIVLIALPAAVCCHVSRRLERQRAQVDVDEAHDDRGGVGLFEADVHPDDAAGVGVRLRSRGRASVRVRVEGQGEG